MKTIHPSQVFQFLILFQRIIFLIALYSTCITSNPYFNGFSRNPFNQGYGLFNYANQIPYNTYIPSFPEPDLAFYLTQQQPLNLIAETPQEIGTRFSIVPMLAVPKDNVNMVASANILGVSQQNPMLTIKTESNSLLQCVPGVRIELEQPMWIYALKKTSIVFPSEVFIYHSGYRIPLKVGAVLAPITQNSFFYNQVPVEVRVVYAVPLPSKPISVETITTTQQVQNSILENVDNQAVVVESGVIEGTGNNSEIFENPKNITIVEFPNTVASPLLPVAEEDEELGM